MRAWRRPRVKAVCQSCSRDVEPARCQVGTAPGNFLKLPSEQTAYDRACHYLYVSCP
jgi:hypothetical protein